MEGSPKRPTFGPAVFYRDPQTALDWLERAFGFERSMVITDKAGSQVHAEMKYGDGYIVVGGEWADFIASPASVGGKNTAALHVQLSEGIDQQCDRARAGGAVIVAEPENQF